MITNSTKNQSVENLNVNNKIHFVFTFEAVNSNPNGDPNCNNIPRQNIFGNGEVTDVCIKRKIRDFVADNFGQNLFISRNTAVNDTIDNALTTATEEKKNVNDVLLDSCWDLRVFGGVTSTGKNNNGQSIKGAVQITNATSVSPIDIETEKITRCASANERTEGKNQTMGERSKVRYALYTLSGQYTPSQGVKNKVSSKDLEFLFSSLIHMLEDDMAENRVLNAKKLTVFEHSSSLGDCNRDSVIKSTKFVLKEGLERAEKFEDYECKNDFESLPKTIKVIEVL